MLRFIGNLIWFIFGGFILSLSWLLCGLLLSITIIGIPFGAQCFKAAKITASPFGKDIDTNFNSHPIINLLWAVLFGWEMALGYLISAIACFVTIIGIPFAFQSLKFIKLALFPFGAKIIKKK